MYPYFYGFDPTVILLIPAMILAFVAQGQVQRNFRRYSQVRAASGLTGAQAARRMLDANGLQNVQIVPISGQLTDHYDPRNRTVSLSQGVYDSSSVSAVSVACHECGHAVQHARNYAPLTIRNSIVPVVNFASSISWILIMVGLMMIFAGSAQSTSTLGNTIFNAGVLCFVAVVLFHLITLPVEFNASRRGLESIREMGFVSPDEYGGARAVLRAAAMTYVAALAMAAANLLRILAIRGRRD